MRAADETIYKYFPYLIKRPGQAKIMGDTYEFIRSNRSGMILSAYSGLGKEPCMTSQAILAVSEGIFDKAIFAIPTDAGKLNIMKEINSVAHNLKVLKISSKNSLCAWVQDKEDERIDALEDEGCGFLICKTMKSECKYYKNGCPYEAQRKEIMGADILVCDYNYLISSFVRKFTGIDEILENNKVLLLVDECHKLPGRAENILSHTLSSNTIERALSELETYNHLGEEGFKREKAQLQKLSEGLNRIVDENQYDLMSQINADYSDYGVIKQTYSALKHISSSGDLLVNAGLRISREKFKNKKGIVSHAERVGEFLNRFEQNKQYIKNHIFFIKLKNDLKTKYIGWSPVTVSAYIRKSLLRANKFILYSGTCHPTERFRKIVGLSEIDMMMPDRVMSPYLKNRKDIVLSNAVFNAENARDKEFIKKARSNINKLIKAMPPHTAIVCTKKLFQRLDLKHDIVMQPDSQGKVEDWIKNEARNANLIYYSPYGRVAESVDLDFLQGIIMIGLPIKTYDAVMQERSLRLSKLYKSGSGNPKYKADNILLIAPAWQAVIQSVMRGIRSERDKIIAVYYDKRYQISRKQLDSQNLSIFDNVHDAVAEIERGKEENL